MNGYAVKHPPLFRAAGKKTTAVPAASVPSKTSTKTAPYTPKPTGSMSYPYYGMAVLSLAFVMIFSMDNFLGLGFLSLILCGRSYDYEDAYNKLHATIAGHPLNVRPNTKNSRDSTSSTTVESEELEMLVAKESSTVAAVEGSASV